MTTAEYERELALITAERDRYRRALARIADANSGPWGWIASEALRLPDRDEGKP